MDVSALRRRRNEEILKEAVVKRIAGDKKVGLVRAVKRRDETENIRAVAEMQMEEMSPRRRTLSDVTWKLGRSVRNGSPTGRNGKFSSRPVTPHRETAARR